MDEYKNIGDDMYEDKGMIKGKEIKDMVEVKDIGEGGEVEEVRTRTRARSRVW